MYGPAWVSLTRGVHRRHVAGRFLFRLLGDLVLMGGNYVLLTTYLKSRIHLIIFVSIPAQI